jgi:hypothetical protein
MREAGSPPAHGQKWREPCFFSWTGVNFPQKNSISILGRQFGAAHFHENRIPSPANGTGAKLPI